MKTTVGQFTIEGDTLTGPTAYMREQSDEKLKAITEGWDVAFNMCSHLSPNVETAILVGLQTDYAGWLGARQLIRALDGGRPAAA